MTIRHYLPSLVWLLMLFSPLTMHCAELFNLPVAFDTPFWSEVLHKQSQQSGNIQMIDGRNVLVLAPGTIYSTEKFPVCGDTLSVTARLRSDEIVPAGPWKMGGIQVFYFKDGKEIGHSDVYLGQKEIKDWKTFSLETPLSRGTDTFSIKIFNLGKNGSLYLDEISWTIETDGSPANGDPEFNAMFGLDHYFPARDNDRDWDNDLWKSPEGKAEIRTNCSPNSGNTLVLTGPSAVSTAKIPYNGEEIKIGFWFRQDAITTGRNPWMNAGVQLVYYNAQGEAIGHGDLTPLVPGSSPWKWYQKTLNAGALNRSIAFIGLVMRIFEGASGTAYFDGVRIVKSSVEDRIPYEEAAGTITINAAKQDDQPIAPIWNGADLSYATQLGEPRVQNALQELKRIGLKHLRLREFLQGCHLVIGRNLDGSYAMDYTLVDRLMDMVIYEYGFIPTLTIETTPDLLAVAPDTDFCNRNMPEDPAEWGKIVEALLNHWVERYGKEEVETWRFECWNEPAATDFFKGTRQEFVSIHQAFLQSIKHVEDKQGVKLLAGTQSGITLSNFFPAIFDAARQAGNIDEIDFISMHIYGGYVNSFSQFESTYKTYRSTFMEPYPELAEKPLLITEYNGDTMSNVNCDDTTGCAFNIKATRVSLDYRVAQLYYFSVIDFLYGTDTREYVGGLGLFARGGQPKAAVNSIVLLNKLTGGKRLEVTRSNDPYDAIAVRFNDGRIGIVYTCFAEGNLRSKASGKLTVTVSGIGENIKNIRHQFCDSKNGNPMAVCEQFGPAAPEEFPERLKLGENTVEDWIVQDGNLTVTLNVELNSAGYLELFF